ncbi:hypothetical protein HWV62_22965 [Athelia sp. TMB]|nr:hypothetical protein HWV62_22965 [Athelia sp. TMB]
MDPRKRKRGELEGGDDVASSPRITYHANGRTFDRLFHEVSLEESKALVRKKLRLPPTAVIQLEQIRDGKLIDLEDDDDFAAFRARAHDVLSLEVKVTLGSELAINPSQPPISNDTSVPEKSQAPPVPDTTNVEEPKRKRQKKKSLPATSPLPDAQSAEPLPKPKSRAEKRKAPESVPTTPDSTAAITSKKRKTNNGDAADVGSKAPELTKEVKKSAGDGTSKGLSKTVEVVLPSKVQPTKSQAKGKASKLAAAGDVVAPVAKGSKTAKNPSPEKPKSSISATKKKAPPISASTPNEQQSKAVEGDDSIPSAIRKKKPKKKPEVEEETPGTAAKIDASAPPKVLKIKPGKVAEHEPQVDKKVESKAVEPPEEVKGKKGKKKKKATESIAASNVHEEDESEQAGPTSAVPSAPPEEAPCAPPAKKSKGKPPRLSLDPAMQARIQADMEAFLARRSPITASPDQIPSTGDRVTDPQIKTRFQADVDALIPENVKPRDPVPPLAEQTKPASVEESDSEVQIPPAQKRSSSRLRYSWGPDEVEEEVVEATPEPESDSELETTPNLAMAASISAPPAPESESETELQSKPPLKASRSSPPPLPSPAPRRASNSHPTPDRGSSPAAKQLRATKNMPCPICLKTPFHLRYKCPILIAGPPAIEKLLEELKSDKTQSQPALVEELEGILKVKKIRGGLAKSAASSPPPQAAPEALTPVKAKSEISRPQNMPTVPKGSRVSEVTVENGDEGSSNEGSDSGGASSSTPSSDDDDEDDEDEDSEDEDDPADKVDRSQIPSAFPGVTSLDDLDLDALIRGPASQSKSVLDDIPSRTNSEEEEEEVVDDIDADEEDEDDQRLRKLAREAKDISSDEVEGEDVDAPVPDPNDTQGGSHNNAMNSGTPPVSPMKEVPGTQQAARILTKHLKAPGGSNGFAESDAETTEVEPSAEESVPAKKISTTSTTSAAKELAASDPSRHGPPVDEPSPLPDPTIDAEESPKKPVKNSPMKRTRQSDPVEAADNPLEMLGHSKLSVTKSPQSPGTKRGRSTARPVSPIESRSSVDLQWPPSPPQSVKDDATSTSPKRETTATVNRSPERGSSESMPPPPTTSLPKKRGRPPLAPEKKAAREKAKLDEKNRKAQEKAEKARVAAEKKQAMAMSTKTPAKRGGLRGSQPTPQSSQVTKASEPITPIATPLEEGPQSLGKWAAIATPASPEGHEGESQHMDELHVDELRSSSRTPPDPEETRPPTSPTPHSKEQVDSRDKTSRPQPLFVPSETQIPFPYSQHQNSMPVEADDSPTESESEGEAPAATPKITSSAPPKFRGLRDLASQEVFNSPDIMSPLASNSTPALKKNLKPVVEDSDDDDDDSDDSGEDSDAKASHIPNSRKAGAQIKPKKRTGLHSFF